MHVGASEWGGHGCFFFYVAVIIQATGHLCGVPHPRWVPIGYQNSPFAHIKAVFTTIEQGLITRLGVYLAPCHGEIEGSNPFIRFRHPSRHVSIVGSKK